MPFVSARLAYWREWVHTPLTEEGVGRHTPRRRRRSSLWLGRMAETHVAPAGHRSNRAPSRPPNKARRKNELTPIFRDTDFSRVIESQFTDRKVELVYVLRDTATGEIYKPGQTSYSPNTASSQSNRGFRRSMLMEARSFFEMPGSTQSLRLTLLCASERLRALLIRWKASGAEPLSNRANAYYGTIRPTLQPVPGAWDMMVGDFRGWRKPQ